MAFLKFLKAEDGIALVYFAVALPVLVGVSVLVIDIGRGNNLHLDLQNAADALAVAAAAELDRGPKARVRADRAIETLVDNQARFGNAGPIIVDELPGGGGSGELVRFYLKTIPADDDTDLGDWIASNPGEIATTDAEAVFVAVFIQPVTYSLLFPINFLGQNEVPIGAEAVAGFDQVICGVAPMFICNPYETAPGVSPDLATAIAPVSERRKLIEMKQKGHASAYAPGNFGYLSSPEGNTGANQLRQIFARVNPEACFSNLVDLRPGQVSSVRTGINVRFDMYKGHFSGGGQGAYKNDPEFRPARTVRKSYDYNGNSCNADLVDPPEPDNFMALPRDDCFLADPQTCTEMGGRRGTGMWDVEQYWQTNFLTTAPNGWTNADPPTRYAAYRYEVDNGLTTVRSDGGDGPGPKGEVGAPQCYGGGTLNDDPDRRLIFAAIINCLEHQDEMNGSAENIPVVDFASFFLTEPVEAGGPDEDVVRAEIVDVTQFGAGTLDAFARDQIQLHR